MKQCKFPVGEDYISHHCGTRFDTYEAMVEHNLKHANAGPDSVEETRAQAFEPAVRLSAFGIPIMIDPGLPRNVARIVGRRQVVTIDTDTGKITVDPLSHQQRAKE